MTEILYEQFSAELDAAMQSHMEWSRRVLHCAVLRTSPGHDVLRTEAHNLCRFGLWFTKNRFIFDKLDAEKARALEVNHRAMHDAIRDICNDVLDNQPGNPARLSTFETTQTLLVEYISQFKTLSTQLGSEIDPLTKLPLRHRLEHNFHILAKRVKRHIDLLAVMMIDIDHFKSFNDQHGHAAGDVVLTRLAACLKDVLRETDQAYRYGGEEFLVLLELPASDGVEIAAQRVLEAVRALSVALPNGAVVNITVTIGVALAVEGLPLDTIIYNADMALYKGKRAGRNRFVIAPSGSYKAVSAA